MAEEILTVEGRKEFREKGNFSQTGGRNIG
jgi:hypothetical protein